MLEREQGIQYGTFDIFYVLVIGYVDGLEPLNEVDVSLELLHRRFQALLVGLLRHGVCDE